jgi:hypothetical protein
MPSEQFDNYINLSFQKQATFWRDHGNVCFVLDQHAYTLFTQLQVS